MPIAVSLTKAKVITKDRLRADRKPLLEAQDVLFMKAQEAGSDTSAIVTEKNRLRDITGDYVNNMDTHVLQILNKMTIKRVAKFILEELLLENKKLIEISKKQKLQIIEMLLRYNIKIDKVEAKENAYVNGGGISTKELNPKTFECKNIENLYFIGETVDVHGPIGGFNITIALSMGYKCGNSI